MNDMQAPHPEQIGAAPPRSRPADPLRRWTLAILVLGILLFGIYPVARRDQAQAQLDAAEAQVKNAQASLEQARQALGPQGADNPQIREALAALELARLDLTRSTLLAPGDGAVSNLQLNIG